MGDAPTNSNKSYIETLIDSPSLCLTSDTENHIPDLCELEAMIPDKAKGNVELYASLRFGLHIDNIWQTDFDITIKKAMLAVKCHGYRVHPNNKLGDTDIDSILEKSTIIAKKTVKKDTSFSVKAGVEISPTSYQPNVHLTGPNSTKTDTTLEATISSNRVQPFVKATTQDKWRIQYPKSQKGALDDRVLNFETLCYLVPLKGNNLKEVMITVTARARDFHFKADENANASLQKKMKSSTTNKKLFKSLVLKRLNNSLPNANSYKGEITLSLTRLADDILGATEFD